LARHVVNSSGEDLAAFGASQGFWVVACRIKQGMRFEPAAGLPLSDP